MGTVPRRHALWVLALLLVACSPNGSGRAAPNPNPDELDFPSRELDRAYREALSATPLPPSALASEINWERNTPIARGEVIHLVQYDAKCDWYAYWLSAMARGDTASAADSLAVLKVIPEWKSFKGTPFEAVYRSIADAAELGDAAVVRAHFPPDGETIGDCPRVHLDNYSGG